MSTVGVSASGQRSLNMTVNDEQRTQATIPTKQGDVVTFSVGGHNGELRLLVAGGSRVERVASPKEGDDTVFYRVIVPGGVSGAHFVRAEGLDGDATDPWPHAGLDVRRNPDPSYHDAWPAEHVGTIGDLVAAAGTE